MRYWIVLICLSMLTACGQGKKQDEGQGEQSPPPQKSAGPVIYMKIAADGTTNMSKVDDPTAQAVSAALGAEPPVEADAQITALRKAAHVEMKHAAIQHDDKGACNATLLLTVDGDAKWKYVQWVMVTVTSPGIGICRIDLIDPRGGAKLSVKLPTDGALDGFDEDLEEDGQSDPGSPRPTKEVRVKLFRDGPVGDRHTWMKLDNDANRYELPSGPEAKQEEAYWDTFRKLRTDLSQRIAKVNPKRFILGTPPPRGGRVPYFDVFQVLRLARDLGMEDIWFEAAQPRTR